jgi:hypothetical protein
MGCQKQLGVDLKTPAQRVAVYNGILAESNRAATAGVISLQKSGVRTASADHQRGPATDAAAYRNHVAH